MLGEGRLGITQNGKTIREDEEEKITKEEIYEEGRENVRKEGCKKE